MRSKPILTIVVALTIIYELVLMAMVYSTVGNQRIHIQLIRLFGQILLIRLIYTRSSSGALKILSAYHIVSAVIGYHTIEESDGDPMAYAISIFHVLAGLLILFHSEIEKFFKLGKVSEEDNQSNK